MAFSFSIHYYHIFMPISGNNTGFGTFGVDKPSSSTTTSENKLNNAIEEIADDLENQHVKEVFGFSSFGRKAKSFDINVCLAWFSNICALWIFYSVVICIFDVRRNKLLKRDKWLRESARQQSVLARRKRMEHLMIKTRMMMTVMKK